jgi:hypothetical protein
MPVEYRQNFFHNSLAHASDDGDIVGPKKVQLSEARCA